MWRHLGLGSLIAACALALLGWNASRFVVAKPKIRAKDLSFLPAPVVAKVLSLGHGNSVAKLRWIDSFAYFQYQLDHKDDTVAGEGGGGFKRLYETLIALDPKFLPFYEHAALNIGGVLGRHDVALAFLQRGLLELPRSTSLWQGVAAELKVYFHWEEQQPRNFDALLTCWQEAEISPGNQYAVIRWKKFMGVRAFHGLEQVPYWRTQLAASRPGTPTGDFIEDSLREILARFGQGELQALVDAYRATHSDPPERLELALEPPLLRQRYSEGLPVDGPVALDHDRPWLRDDPYGFPWFYARGEVFSIGLNQIEMETLITKVNNRLVGMARERGRWPTSLEEIRSWGLFLPESVPGGTLALDGQTVSVAWSVKPGPPWPLRAVK
jgi:hypothetical protein